MAFKVLVVVAVTLAAAVNASGPLAAVTYSAAPAVSHVSYSSPIVSYGTPLTSANAPAITSQSSNILRSFGNLGQVSTYSKTIDTPFSSVRKADIRVSNPGLRVAATPFAYQGYAAHAAPLGYAAAPIAPLGYAAAPALHHAPAAIGVAYSAAPAVSHVTYTGLGASYGW